MNSPILALDLGTKRTGVALNPTGSLILELPTIIYGTDEDFMVRVAEVITEHQPRTLVVGRPRSGDSPVAALLDGLKQLPGCPSIVVLDEALSTKEAERQLAGEHVVGGDSDARAARLILQQYIDNNQVSTTKGEL